VIEQNRAALERALDRFDSYLDTLAASQHVLDLDFVTRALFMLNMLIYGCVHRYAVDGGEEQTLIPFSAVGTRNRDQGFLMRAAKLTMRLWGRDFKDGIMARVAVDREQDAMPVPLVTLIILSRWVLAAILAEAQSAQGARSLSAVLETQIPRLWRMTEMFGPIDSAQVETTIAKMARLTGVDQRQGQAIQRAISVLGTGSPLKGAQ
jgi:hypothetical protein